jgi:hypothetical protein
VTKTVKVKIKALYGGTSKTADVTVKA